MKYCIGIGLTSRCNFHCGHCYSRINGSAAIDLSFKDIKHLCETLDIEAVNFGSGESILHPEFLDIVDYFHLKGIRMGLTTNGLTVKKMSNDNLTYFNDIDFSLDFPDRTRHDHFRGKKAYDNVIDGIRRCKDNGVDCSIVACLMNINYLLMDDLACFAERFNIFLRVNCYKPVRSELFKPSYFQFMEGIALLFKNSRIISCSEPVINVALKISGSEPRSRGIKCGNASFKVHPDRTLSPCVYLPHRHRTIDNIEEEGFNKCEEMTIVPKACLKCDFLDLCQGGCTSRRIFRDIYEPDEYCPLSKKQRIDLSNVEFSRQSEHIDLVHSNYLCTIIVEGK